MPADKRRGVVDFLRGKGMDCSVYAAQYLLEGLFNHGAADKALSLITADNDRSWKHMVDSGTTITWEAWDLKYKPNHTSPGYDRQAVPTRFNLPAAESIPCSLLRTRQAWSPLQFMVKTR